MRDWSKAFRRASFGGVRFWVEEDGPSKGRRVAVHNICGGEAPVTEDLGRIATHYRVTAYVVSDSADREAATLERVCDAPRAARLVLPMDSARMAHCVGCSRKRSKDRNGYIAYDLTFLEAGGGGQGNVSGIPALRQVFSAGVSGAAAALAGGL